MPETVAPPPPCRVDHEAADGDVLDFANGAVVLHVGGHTPAASRCTCLAWASCSPVISSPSPAAMSSSVRSIQTVISRGGLSAVSPAPMPHRRIWPRRSSADRRSPATGTLHRPARVVPPPGSRTGLRDRVRTRQPMGSLTVVRAARCQPRAEPDDLHSLPEGRRRTRRRARFGREGIRRLDAVSHAE
jgi:hypothetical protein